MRCPQLFCSFTQLESLLHFSISSFSRLPPLPTTFALRGLLMQAGCHSSYYESKTCVPLVLCVLSWVGQAVRFIVFKCSFQSVNTKAKKSLGMFLLTEDFKRLNLVLKLKNNIPLSVSLKQLSSSTCNSMFLLNATKSSTQLKHCHHVLVQENKQMPKASNKNEQHSLYLFLFLLYQKKSPKQPPCENSPQPEKQTNIKKIKCLLLLPKRSKLS